MQTKRFGLVGKNISYSFSKSYFANKFQENNNFDCEYENIDLQTIQELPNYLKKNPELIGLNVTIPYKETILPFLDELSETAKIIGAVNTIKITPGGKLIGYNTDYFGFQKALKPMLKPYHKKALILGTGGASKGVAFALKELEIDVTFVSRNASDKNLVYSQITPEIFDEHKIIINCTPIGTSPKIHECVPIPFNCFSGKHIAFDLIYNPSETLFLKNAKKQGAQIQNGLEMLIFQAEKSWEIWNKKT